MNYKRFIGSIIVLALVLCRGALWAQQGEAGVESPFSIGLGARALGMGNAAVAFPDDPSAFIWNPAGMVVVQQKGIGLSLTTLFEGTQYNFLGYVHPTISTGTFGLGITRIGTGGVKHTDLINGVPVDLGELNYYWAQFLFGYAITLWKGISLGINFNVNRQVLGFYSTNGFGVDVGLHYRLPVERGILKDFYFGANWANALRPRMKLGVSSESVPYTFRAGFAKVFNLRRGADRWILLMDYEKGEHSKSRYHVGMEYGIGGMIFARAGLNGGEICFGGGLRWWNFQLDYANSRFGDPAYFPRSHRFTLLFYFGKPIPEQRRILEERRRQEVQARIQERMEEDRERRISEGLRAGKEYLQREDFFNARLEFSRVLRENPEDQEARELLDQTTAQEQALQKQREDNLLLQARERERREQDNEFVNQRFNEGLEALSQGDFRKAIEKWHQALDRDPDNPQINNYIQQAENELTNEVNRLIARANQLVRQENISEAYKVLERAKYQTETHPALNQKVEREIRTLDRIVDFVTNYQEGVRRYGSGDYEAAARSLQKALEYYPNHERARELYRNALARSKEQKLEMTPEVKQLWVRGGLLYIDGRYEEAIEVWEEALTLDPHNVTILESIDGARRKIELYKKK